MHLTQRSRRIALFLALYLIFCAIAGKFVADGTLHPARRPLTAEEESVSRQLARQLDSDLADVTITTPDSVVLRAWTIQPRRNNGDAVILWQVPGADHCGAIGADPHQFEQRLLGWFSQHPATADTKPETRNKKPGTEN